MNFEELTHLAMEAGFTHAVPLDVHTIDLKAEVRDMCASGGCGKYGACWSCPPACGTLDECRARVLQYTKGIIVQTVGELEDPLDGEGMMETEDMHKKSFDRMYALLREQHADVLALGAGGCKKCAVCTYPDAPCRRPNEMVSSSLRDAGHGDLPAQPSEILLWTKYHCLSGLLPVRKGG